MPRWTVYLRIMFVTPNRTNRYTDDGGERHRVVAEHERLEAADEQHRKDGGGEGHRFAERHAVVAVEVGQHAGEAAHRAGDDRRVERHAVDEVADAGVPAAEHGARRHVHAEAGHGRFESDGVRMAEMPNCADSAADANAARRLYGELTLREPKVQRVGVEC